MTRSLEAAARVMAETSTLEEELASGVRAKLEELEAPSARIVSSARSEHVGGHDRVRVWNRGALSGELVVTAGDGDAILERLVGGMVQGRANASDALDEAAELMTRIADNLDLVGALPRNVRELRDGACKARGAAVEVRKEIHTPRRGG